MAVKGDGGWVLNGAKNFITHGISGETCVVLAITDREMRPRGISAFIVERGTPGFLAGRKENKLGVRASETASILFEDCCVPDDASLKDRHLPTTKELAMAKLYASEIGVKVCEEAIQIHGGYGYTKDYPVEKYWRDSKICTIGEGTSEVQRLVIARQLLVA